MNKISNRAGSRPSIRCAIYTRTSTDERLARELNSLDVQREACAAFITSQRHEGWIPCRTKYDDGGYSGGTLRRPALSRLLNDISQGKVDTIVVYKIDRLTRSLSDFAKIMDVLDGAGASFVSVTQSFNTQASMGRLTLNVLLSFAQFERELGSERVRDRIAAAKARGLWTGGTVPLGYDVVDRKLLVNSEEARTVCHIMDTYLRLGSVTETAATLDAEGVRTKLQLHGRGRRKGGNPFGAGALRYLLGNELYVGKVGHGSLRHEGQHQPIVESDLWEGVQKKLSANAFARRCGRGTRNPSLLAGIIWDKAGRRMSPAHTTKRNIRYRYYCSNRATLPEAAEVKLAMKVWRMPADELEAAVRTGVAVAVQNEPVPAEWTERNGAEAWAAWSAAISGISGRLRDGATSQAREILLNLRLRAIAEDDHLKVIFSRLALTTLVADAPAEGPGVPSGDDQIHCRVPAAVRKCGQSIKLILLPEGARHRNPALVTLIAAAFSARRKLMSKETAGLDGKARRTLARSARLSYLAPDIIEAVLAGEQPPGLTATKLRRSGRLPLRWDDQRRLLGFETDGRAAW